MRILTSFLLIIGLQTGVGAQTGPYAPAAGKWGSTAVSKDTSIIARWADNCTVIRGYQDIADKSLGKVSHGTDSLALGMADNQVVSLGDSGVATFLFSPPISDVNGMDFAIFENSFDDRYLELAFVEVSSDGQNYFRFPSASLTQTQVQTGPYGYTEPTDLHNLAGKYRGGYGTPFDLNDLDTVPGLNIQSITHIRVVDVIGTLDPDHATYDASGRVVNDPYATPFPSGGFDLDALAVLSPNTLSVKELDNDLVRVRVDDQAIFVTVGPGVQMKVTAMDITGRILDVDEAEGECRIEPGASGIVLLRTEVNGGMNIQRIFLN